MHTQVAIIGAGPAGLFLSHLLHREGIECIVLESRSRAYVEDRVRAGVLEQGTVDLMAELGLDQRLRRECMIDEAIDIRFGNGKLIHVNFPELVAGKVVTIYGQQEVVKDLIAARIAQDAPIEFDAEVTELKGLDTGRPTVRYRKDGQEYEITCNVVAGCDGFHGVCRAAIPEGVLKTFDHVYPFGWLGILSESPPIKEMTYANHDNGFALCSRRSPKVSRHYLQVASDEDPANWSDDRFWNELHIRMNDHDKSEIVEGRIFQKNVAPLRAFVSEPMRYGRLFLAGDASHIVPPTGAKGLNLAVADVRVLARSLTHYFRTGSMEKLDRYSETCLKRIWKVVRYSWFMTSLLHRFPHHTPFERNIQLGELEYLLSSRAGHLTIAENYVGLPLEDF
jgi:p-hydroxybenzoate 3-monooxygenase